ncbi:hypothetical protein PsorP6_016182 [Peronosclerospora sorghi]|uniref:Uncharacterized protein n=1 Tax=Peronosclerospora sorghi TaxID=230839 RepID=A0ACC0VPB9_9STRA|nr:hypothetical protein PsorP6_016182 [Peronosclerospora sorghi]
MLELFFQKANTGNVLRLYRYGLVRLLAPAVCPDGSAEGGSMHCPLKVDVGETMRIITAVHFVISPKLHMIMRGTILGTATTHELGKYNIE